MKDQKRSVSVCETTGFRRYNCKADAKNVAKQIAWQQGIAVPGVRHCPHCGGWHFKGSR